ncbi:FG-GAP repeat protein [Streptomyces sp. NPDC056835]|uniref:FG-GAP repeat protein n=1 Tax=Streptomyces sp. NPDC056835 TaxID=3345956 RepID=UPI00368B2B18
MPRVFGHRDTNATACPGAGLYAKLPLIRTLAATPGISHALATSDLTGDEFGGSPAYGDVNSDGYADLALGSPGEDDTTGHADAGAVTVLYGPNLSSGTSYTTATATRAAGEKLAGTALLFRGSATGITGTGELSYSQDTTDIAGATGFGDRLASSVVLHDLSGFGRADLAIRADGEDGEDGGDGVVLHPDSGSGSPGISARGGVYYSRSNLGTPATAHLGRTPAP